MNAKAARAAHCAAALLLPRGAVQALPEPSSLGGARARGRADVRPRGSFMCLFLCYVSCVTAHKSIVQSYGWSCVHIIFDQF